MSKNQSRKQSKKRKKPVPRKRASVRAPGVPLFVTVPHCGEKVPPEARWLKGVPKETLLTDVDRFVHQLYEPAIRKLGLPHVFATVHRYAADLNRYPQDVDQASVAGAAEPAGQFTSGFHWVRTTQGRRLMPEPIPGSLHDLIVRKYHDTFHQRIARVVSTLRKRHGERPIFHLDCHSMPSEGTDAHPDRGGKRPDAVVSDYHGKSSRPEFRDLVIRALEAEGFEVAHNWPYFGGRITQRYGRPENGHHTIQIELNRRLYMNEDTRQKLPEFADTRRRLCRALEAISKEVAGNFLPV